MTTRDEALRVYLAELESRDVPSGSDSNSRNDQLLAVLRVFIHHEGEYYSVYGKSCYLIADDVFKTRLSIRRNSCGIECLSLSRLKFRRALNTFVVKQRIPLEIHEEKFGEFHCIATASAGNTSAIESILALSDDVDAENGADSVTIAVHFSKNNEKLQVGMIVVNASQKRIKIYEFER